MKTMKIRQRGVALVELALIIPFLLLLTFITTEFGRAMYEYNAVAKATRDAVRYLSFQTPGTHITERILNSAMLAAGPRLVSLEASSLR